MRSFYQNVDSDIGGDEYKVNIKVILGFSLRVSLYMNFIDKIVNDLFLIQSNVIFSCDTRIEFNNFTLHELHLACSEIRNNNAPDRRYIPLEIIEAVAVGNPNFVLQLYNKLAEDAIFLADWNKTKSVLLCKGNKPFDSPPLSG